MKSNYFLVLLFLLLISVNSNGQGKFTESLTLYPIGSTAVMEQTLTIPSDYTYQGQNPSYSVSYSSNIGEITDNPTITVIKNSDKKEAQLQVQRKTVYRTFYEIPLNSLKYTTTNNFTITSLILHYYVSGYSQASTFKITQPSSSSSSNSEIFGTVGNSSSKQTGITYSSSSLNAAGLADPIKSAISSGHIYLGIACESEATSGTNASVSNFYIEITYERNNEARSVVAQNDIHGYHGGNILWDGTSYSSPKSQTLYENVTHSFGVVTPQTINDGQTYNSLWHLGAVNTSYWGKQVNNDLPSNLGTPTSVSYTTNWKEVGTITHTAYLRRVCNVTFNGGGGTVTIDNGSAQAFPQSRQVIEKNPITAVASNYSANGLDYTFQNSWTNSSGQSVSTTVLPEQHETYTANYLMTLAGNATLQSDMTVPAGQTLTIQSGMTVTLNGHKIISTGGTINVQGTVNGLKAKVTTSNVLKGLYPTIQSAVDGCPAYSYVDIVSGPNNENVSVSGKNNLYIAGAGRESTTLTGSFSLYGCNNLLLEAVTLKQLNVYYCSPCTLWCDIDADFTDNGLGLFYCNLYNHSGSVNYCNTGLNAYSTSGYAESSDYGASSCNIYASSGSNITADYDWFCNPVTTDFIAVSSSYINPSGSYFPAGHPISSGNVATPLPRFSCTAKKNVNFDESKDFPASQIQIDDPAKDEFIKVNDSYFSLMKKTKDNPKSREALKNEMPDILKAYKSFIKKNPKSTFSRTALTTAANSYWLTEDYNGRKSFLDEIINDKELTSLKGYAESMMIDNYIKSKDADGAITAADAFMEKYKNDGELICEGLMKKGLVLTYELKQPDKAAECFSAIVKNYPESPLASFAKNSLEAINEKAKGSKKEDKEVVSAGFSAGAYPNPFNPSTTIKYSLPENCRVSLEVYNILGEKAASLVNDVKSAGSYSAVFNGSSLASGIYIYKITAVSMQTGKQFVKSDKIMLVK